MISEPDVLSFQRENHVYKIGHTEVPSVTKVLRMAGLVRWHASREVMEKACRRGRIAHMVCADINFGVNDYWSHDQETMGFALGWQKFLKTSDFLPEQIEKQVSHPLYRYAGTYDLRGWINASSARKRKMLVEIKTGQYSEWHGEQLAGYSLCFPPEEKVGRMAVYLPGDETFHVEHFESPVCCTNFLAALAIGRLREQRRLYHEDEDFNRSISGLDEYRGAHELLNSLGW
jgi:hypothetical protein